MEPIVVVLQPGRQALYLMLRDPLVIGRECDGLVLADAQVSRRHLELRGQDGAVVVTDLGSTNGTVIDGARVDGPTALQPGQALVLGETVVRVVASAPAAADDGRRTVVTAAAVEGAGSQPVRSRRGPSRLLSFQSSSTRFQPGDDAVQVVTLASTGGTDQPPQWPTRSSDARSECHHLGVALMLEPAPFVR